MAAAGNAELEARIAQLEAENAALRQSAVAAPRAEAEPPPPRRRGRGRTIAAVALVLVGLLLAPVAVVGAWARIQLVDTERFVATFAPLAQDPEVQDFVSAEITTRILAEVNVPQIAGNVFDGIRSLDLPPRAEQALTLLEGPAVSGIEQLIGRTVQRVVESPQFADIWSTGLRLTHRNFVAALQGDPNAAVAIGGSGTLSLQLGPIIAEVKERLIASGVGIATLIPTITASVVLVRNDSLVLVQSLYSLAVAAGTWLPWVALAFLVAGVLVAKRPLRALAWTAAGLALTMMVFAAGLGIARLFFIGTVSPSIVPSDAAESMYDAVVELMQSVSAALIVLSIAVALIAWLAGPSRQAVAARSYADSGFAVLRGSAEKRGITTGRFGVALDRFATPVFAGIALIASAVILFSRPLRVELIVWTVVLSLLAVLVVQLLRRPPGEAEEAEVAAARGVAPSPEREAASVADSTLDLDEADVTAPITPRSTS